MSVNQYNQAPPVSGKVKLHTSQGDVLIELWTKECPKACRNFIQLCLEGYYDNTIFHRIVKDYLIQGGDPTGTGEGGESVYGAPFPNEIHSRLRFSTRGMVAMAGSNNDNASQFFITLGPCPWLDRKHTLFGRVSGSSIFNILPLSEFETDKNERPLFPPTLLNTTVLENPFDDIEPRELPPRAKSDLKPDNKALKEGEIQEGTTKAAASKEQLPKQLCRSLLSFEDEEEGDEEEIPNRIMGMRSSHDVLNDARLLKQPSYTPEQLQEIQEKSRKEKEKKEKLIGKIKQAAVAAAGAATKGMAVGQGETSNEIELDKDDNSEAENGEEQEENGEEELKIKTKQIIPQRRPKESEEERQLLEDVDSWSGLPDSELTPTQLSIKRRQEASQKFAEMKREMLQYKKKKTEEENEKANRELSYLELRRQQYLKKKTPQSERQKQNLERMKAFQTMLSVTAQIQQRDEKLQVTSSTPSKDIQSSTPEQQQQEEEEEIEIPVHKNIRERSPSPPMRQLEETNSANVNTVNSLTDNPAHKLVAIMDDEDSDEDTNWLTHRLQCEKKEDHTMDDYYTVTDPLEFGSENSANQKRLNRLKQIRSDDHSQNERQRQLETAQMHKRRKLT